MIPADQGSCDNRQTKNAPFRRRARLYSPLLSWLFDAGLREQPQRFQPGRAALARLGSSG